MSPHNDTVTAENIIREAARLLPADRRRAVYQVLDDGATELVSEARAASIMGISRSHLYRWRTGALKTATHFPFKIFTPPGTSHVRYNLYEVRDYIIKSMHGDEQQEEETG